MTTTSNANVFVSGKQLERTHTLEELPDLMRPGTVWHDHKGRRWAVIRWWGEYFGPGKMVPTAVELLNLADEQMKEVQAAVIHERYKAGQLKTRKQLELENEQLKSRYKNGSIQ